jgi:hypothetical protein
VRQLWWGNRWPRLFQYHFCATLELYSTDAILSYQHLVVLARLVVEGWWAKHPYDLSVWTVCACNSSGNRKTWFSTFSWYRVGSTVLQSRYITFYLNMTAFWDKAPCSLTTDLSFTGMYWLHPSGQIRAMRWSTGLLQRDYSETSIHRSHMHCFHSSIIHFLWSLYIAHISNFPATIIFPHSYIFSRSFRYDG